MRQYIKQYLRNCRTCRQAKPVRHFPFGILKTLSVPQRPWQHVSMDFVTGLPVSKGLDAILVVVDRLTKMWHLIHWKETTGAAELAHLYLEHV